MDRLYLVPVERVTRPDGNYANGPKYFRWKYDPDPPGIVVDRLSNQYFGFHPWTLTMAQGISQADHDFLALQVDVYVYPLLDQLDDSIAPTDDIDTFYEAINIPTDWMTPANTYREFLRQTMGMFTFHNRYEFKSGGHSLFEGGGLDTRLRQLSAEEEEWFYQTAESFGIDRSQINRQNQLRQLLKQASDLFASWDFALGGITI